MEMYRTLGATAIQKPMTEVLTALQANVIDGLDNTALYIQAGGLAQPLDYFTLSRHIYQPAAIVLSKRWMDSIDAELQKIVLEEGKILTQKGRDAIREEEQAMMENFEMFNVEVIELSKEEREGFAKVARTMHDSFAENISGGTDLLNDIRAALKALRAK
jgi:TRAP-type C4-dicarboxylate transport system substrate-binding protein